MFNSIRQYLSFSHHDSHNDEYIHQDNSWRQQKNHLLGNWLSDVVSQQAEEKESNRHFWNRRSRKKYYKNDLYNDELYQQQHHHHHQPQLPLQHLSQTQAQHQLQGQSQHLYQQPMFDRRRSHKSLSSLFRRDSTSNLMHQQLHQPMFNGENIGHDYRRQRHHSLPSSHNGPHNKHQDNFLNHQQQPYFPPSGIHPNGFNKHGGLDTDFSSYYGQKQHLSMMNGNNRHYNQEPMYSKSMQQYPQQQSYFNNPGSARELQQQQQQMLYFQQQFPYSGINPGYGGNRLAGNHNFYNNDIMTNNKMFR